MTNKPLARELSDYYHSLTAGHTTGKNELLLLLYNFSLGDSDKYDLANSYHFYGDFFRGHDGKYNYCGNTDTIIKFVQERKEGLDNAINQFTADILTNYMLMPLTGPQELYTEDEALQKRKNDKLKYPIYNMQRFKKGIYRSIDQFLNNAPSDTVFIKDVEYRQGYNRDIDFYYPNKKGKPGVLIPRDSVFACYDGERWYVQEQKEFKGPYVFENMEFKDGEFYAERSFSVQNGDMDYINSVLYFPLVPGPSKEILHGIKGLRIVRSMVKEPWRYVSKLDPVQKTFKPLILARVPNYE